MQHRYRPYDRVDPIFDRSVEKLKAEGSQQLDEETIYKYYVYYWTQAPYEDLPPLIAIKLFYHTPDLGIEQAWDALQGACKAAMGEDPGNMGKRDTVRHALLCDEDMLLAALRSEIAACYGSNKEHSYDR